MTILKKTGLFALLLSLGCSCVGLAQSVRWQQADRSGEPFIRPAAYEVYNIDEAQLMTLLQGIPADENFAVEVPLPIPGGKSRMFRVWATPIGEASLMNRHPELLTFTGIATDDSRVTAKIDHTIYGFHAQILDGKDIVYLDPLNSGSTGSYLVYRRSDLKSPSGAPMVCETAEATWATSESDEAQKTNGTIRRRYRLALACTGEYAVAVTGTATPTKAQVLAKMVTSVNRVNGVYERELAISLQLIGNTDTLIFLDGTTDPYTNNNGSSMLGENQTTVTARIGSANYDMGHVFSTGGGGVAVAGVCNVNNKAKGVTGLANPVGDAFDIDYVAHEMGHQFSASHTFNANTGSCAGNGVTTSAYEPGSGTTIMAYAGICAATDNTQPHSDPYFHARSLDQITNYVVSSATCASTSATANVPPVVPSFGAVYYVPWLTPFELTAPQAVDVTTDEPLTYSWEERDLGQFGSSFNATRYAGPLFRSFAPDVSRTRVFPTPRRLVRNVRNYLGEKLPDTARTLRFMLTVRDVLNGFGSFNWVNTDTIRLQVIQAADTFGVLSFNTPSQIGYNELTQKVDWNVSNTSSTPIDASMVDIYYSTDSGYTWPYLLKSSTPNDGSETVTLPNVATNAGRIKIKGSGNVFFDINDQPMIVAQAPYSVASVGWAAQVEVFPVPAKEQLTVRLPSHAGTIPAKVLDVLGREVWKGSVSRQSTLDVISWPRGVYSVLLIDPATQGQITKTVVLQ
jgi:hypothetical protein